MSISAIKAMFKPEVHRGYLTTLNRRYEELAAMQPPKAPPGITATDLNNLHELYFKDEYRTIQQLMNDNARSKEYRAYAKELFDELAHMQHQHKLSQRT